MSSKIKSTSMSPKLVFYIANKNLLSKRLRTTLTVLGIAVGIGAIFFLLSFGLGLQNLVTNEVIGSQSIKTIDVSTPNSKIIKIDDINSQRISEIPNVENIGKAYYFPGGFKISNSESDSIVYGIDNGYEKLTNLNLVTGKLIEDKQTEKVAIINLSALESVGLAKNPGDIIGKNIEVIVPLSNIIDSKETYNETFKIVGVINSGSGAEIFIPSNIFRNLGVANLTQLKVGANNVESVPKIRSQIESIGLETASPVDTLEDINRVFRFLNLILVGFGGIGMIIAILGMFNTLTISLLERTKEIGLMIALGARSVDIKRIFIIEALMLSIAGSLIGIIGAFAIGRIVNLLMNVMAARRGVSDNFELFSNPPILILGTLIFMALIGLLVVLLPARRAQRINAIEALRRE
jgi:ABC-type antimicrobial peptide transport system permease subunit